MALMYCSIACSAGTYRALSDNSCRSCPENTDRSMVAASECSCVAGFYRNNSPQEGPEVGCTGNLLTLALTIYYSCSVNMQDVTNHLI